MESGQVHLDDRIRGVYCYYFLVDPESPTAPVPKRTRRFIIGCSVESYVEAFFGLVRHLNRDKLNSNNNNNEMSSSAKDLLPPPPSANVSTIGDISNINNNNNNRDPTNTEITTSYGNNQNTTNELLRPWSHLYSSAFGPLAFDTFCRRVMSSESTFLFCERNEEEARIKAAQLANPTGAAWGETSTKVVSPSKKNPTILNREAASFAASPQLPGDTSPYRNGSRLKGLNSSFEGGSSSSTQQPQSAISGNASHRLSQIMAGQHHHHHNHNSDVTISQAAKNEGLQAAAHRVAGLGNLNSSGGGGGGGNHPSYLTSGNTEFDTAKLKQELGDAANQLLLERSRAVVQNLSDAERAALIYKYESVRKELEEERKRTSNLRETLRVTMSDFEERLERLQQSSANALSEAAARERHNLDSLDKELSTKFKNERDQLELNLLERDRKLAKSLARVEFLEGQCDALQKKSDLLATEEQRAAAFCVKSKAEQERLEDECNRLRRSLASVEGRLDDETRLRRNTEVAYKSLEQHATSMKGENDKLRRDCEKFAQYSVALHEELRSLDASANAAADFFNRQQMRNPQQQQQMSYGGGGRQQQSSYGGGGSIQSRLPPFPSGYGM